MKLVIGARFALVGCVLAVSACGGGSGDAPGPAAAAAVSNGSAAPAAGGPGSTGAAGDPGVGFDIHSTIRDGVSIGNRALASLSTADGNTALFGVVLSTGKAELRGNFDRQNQVIGIAIPLDQD